MRMGKGFKPWMYAEFDGAGGGGRHKMMLHVNDRLGCKTSLLVDPGMKVRELKKRVGAKLYKNPHSLLLRKASLVLRDDMELRDYEIHDGFNVELDYKGIADLS